jgi:hypothetical protein
MTEKICPECSGEGAVDQGTEDERRCPTDNQRRMPAPRTGCPTVAKARAGHVCSALPHARMRCGPS